MPNTSNPTDVPIDTKKMNIYQKMLRISAEIKTIGKSVDVPTGYNKSYKAVAEKDILAAVKPLEEKYGVFSYPKERVVLESQMYENEVFQNNQVLKKMSFMMRIMTVYRFVNVDNPDDFVETTTFAEGIDAQDKGSGKAMTYCDKYALLKAYKISTGDVGDEAEPDSGSDNGYYPQNSQQYGSYYDQTPPPPEPPPYYGSSRGQGNVSSKQQKQNTSKQQHFQTPPQAQNEVGRWKGA